jgi:carboxypeptidase Taq
MAGNGSAAYQDLLRRVRGVMLLGSCGSLLGWDQQTYMPARGTAHRAEQLALLAGLAHAQFTAPELGELLATAQASPVGREPDAAVNLREIRRLYERATRVPGALVEAIARTTAQAQEIWIAARKASDFGRFRPWLEKIIGLKREEAAAIGGGPMYDVLLDEYEPGATAAGLAALFAELAPALRDLVARIAASGRQPDASLLQRTYPVAAQEAFGRTVAAAFGFDFGAGRLDPTTHPFCSGIGPGDTRLTTRYNPQDFGDAFFSIVHETGHGLYDQGLDPERYGTPLGAPVSLGIHESQSRLWENFVGRSRAFWEHWLPQAAAAFPEALSGVPVDDFFFAVNDVRPSFIRVDADEATYNLHILLRFELEQSLLSGALAVADLPSAWAEGMRKNLGIVPPNDAQGCLQDIHWSGGSFGYFPTYTLGNLYAAQLFATAEKALDLPACFRRGEYRPLQEWLREKIYRQGQRYRAVDLVTQVSGAPPSPAFLLRHLRDKLEPLYGL